MPCQLSVSLMVHPSSKACRDDGAEKKKEQRVEEEVSACECKLVQVLNYMNIQGKFKVIETCWPAIILINNT